jgi:hypothetical protein
MTISRFTIVYVHTLCYFLYLHLSHRISMLLSRFMQSQSRILELTGLLNDAAACIFNLNDIMVLAFF